ncbi:hypothetical protein ACDY97_13700 [Rhizobium mongolense]|uniref:hypothetical protein n=1 Tax=Rhizobium TaxID=379 RepID=UPI0024B0DC52|nr:hypothetical protein [Rhizobium sp. CC1099]WFU91968.1 hypothetical protein QA644_26695 [Rhizobium sp. CC1099]
MPYLNQGRMMPQSFESILESLRQGIVLLDPGASGEADRRTAPRLNRGSQCKGIRIDICRYTSNYAKQRFFRAQ